MKRYKWIFAGVLFAAIFFVPAAKAGGWVVMTLTDLPKQIIAGENYEFEFSIRRHGQQLEPGNSPSVYVTNAETREAFRVSAVAAGTPGFYSANVVFPSAGEWDWSLELYEGYAQTMPKINVLTPSAIEPVRGNDNPFSRGVVLSIVGVISFLTGLVGYIFNRSKSFALIAGTGIILSLLGLAIAPPQVAVAKNVVAKAAAVEISDQAFGRDLFLAKGCVVCHNYDSVMGDFKGVHTAFGPNLSQMKFTEAYLRLWLANPSLVKPDTEMPNLGLTSDEINALASFLTKE